MIVRDVREFNNNSHFNRWTEEVAVVAASWQDDTLELIQGARTPETTEAGTAVLSTGEASGAGEASGIKTTLTTGQLDNFNKDLCTLR